MNRQVVHTALGRRRALDSCRENAAQCLRAASSSSIIRGQPISWQTYSSFSTTMTHSLASSDKAPPTARERSSAAASKLAELGGGGGGQSRPAPATSQPSAATTPPPGPVDVRTMGSSFAAFGPKVINLRSLRGRLGAAGPAARAGPPRFAARPASFAGPGVTGGGRFTPGAAARGVGRFAPGGAARGGGRFGPGAGAPGGDRFAPRARRGTTRGRGRGGEKRGSRGGKGEDTERLKARWTPEEQEVINRMEQGVVTAYVPTVTAESLAGYGPALASDAAVAKMESAMRAMRILGGGRPFDPVTTVTGDIREAVKRYSHEKKPLFFSSKEEKEWLESCRPGFRFKPAEDATKQAVLDAAVLGKYEKPQFVDVSNVMGTLANYHSREPTYLPSDSQAFMAKVRELLPAARKPPGAAPVKTVA